MNKENRKAYLPIVLLFIVFNGIILVAKSFLENNGFDISFLVWANVFLLMPFLRSSVCQRVHLTMSVSLLWLSTMSSSAACVIH